MVGCGDLEPFPEPFPEGDFKCEPVLGNRISTVLFYPETKDVYDKDRNYLGKGVLKDGILVITPNSISSSSDTQE